MGLWLIPLVVLFIIVYYIYRELFYLYIFRNLFFRYPNIKDRHRALKTYKAFLNRGFDSVFSKVSLTVFELFVYQIQFEGVVERKDTVEDMGMLDISDMMRLKVMRKRKSDIDGDDE